MLDNPTLFHQVKSIEKDIEERSHNQLRKAIR